MNLARHLARHEVKHTGGQLGTGGDYRFALEAALLLDRIQKEYGEVFKGNPSWQRRVPGWLV